METDLKNRNRKISNTPCSKKPSPLMFDNNFGKCRPIFKIFPPGDS